ncbi:PLP-dependent aminotransferase family protein [Oceanimonas sp. MB9]|uniref:aminotransferase-like domain-containing protein n=1 Tax=Oceanimonas sp. MB9 TaxID=2588453 RepID=UPI0019808EC2|nr:PLP-dependent aminotransferase family protein [Oceanimonas sp. MB9]NHI01107.1 HTH-type transcriptional regulator NorG [Oceanimonas sp. MB9]
MAMARYRQLAEKFITDIQAGRLAPGERLLSLRQLARQHGISMSTAVSCYAELESLGWLVARPKAGFFVAAGRPVAPAPEWASFASRVATPERGRSRARERNGGPLGTALLGLDEATRNGLDRSFRRALAATAGRIGEYPPPLGEPALLAALTSHFSQAGFALGADELMITHGCMAAVQSALEICTRPGDAVAISSPCYNGLLELLAHMSRRIVEIPSRADGIDLDQLERLMAEGTVQAGLFCTSHMNPQGITMSVAQKQRLARLASRYRVPVIEDDVYLELAHGDRMPLPAAWYDEEGYVIWCGSVSKTLSPGYRLGWCRPGRFGAAMASRLFGVPTLVQLAMADFIDTGAYARHLRRTRIRLIRQKQFYLDYLARRLPSGSRIAQPDGGLVLWLQVPGLAAEALGQAARGAGLDIRTGDLFTASAHYRDCLRINMGFAFDEQVRLELDTLVRLIEAHCA